jgi:hypothetical protein
MKQQHTVVMSLGHSRVEFNSALSLQSWNGSVLVMVSGYVHLKNYAGRRNFVQTFYLAPQEKVILYLMIYFTSLMRIKFISIQQSYYPITLLTPN